MKSAKNTRTFGKAENPANQFKPHFKTISKDILSQKYITFQMNNAKKSKSKIGVIIKMLTYMKNKVLTIVLIISIFIICLLSCKIVSLNYEFANQIMTYEYLNKYKVWYGIFKVTNYTLCQTECGKFKGHKEYGITASGLQAVPGRTVAVDKHIVPLGSILIDIQTGKKYIAEDTGSKIKGYMVDIFVGTGSPANRKNAQDFGTQQRMFIVVE